GDGDHDLLRQAPTELLGDLVGEGLGAFCVIGAQVDVHKAPSLTDRVTDEFGAETVHVVVIAVDGHHFSAVDGGHDDLGLFQAGRDEHTGVEPGSCGGGTDGPGEVTGGGTGKCGEPERAGGLYGHGDHTVLEGMD